MSEHSDQPDHESGGTPEESAPSAAGDTAGSRSVGGPGPAETGRLATPDGPPASTPEDPTLGNPVLDTSNEATPATSPVDTPLHGVDAPSPAQDATLGTVAPGYETTLAPSATPPFGTPAGTAAPGGAIPLGPASGDTEAVPYTPYNSPYYGGPGPGGAPAALVAGADAGAAGGYPPYNPPSPSAPKERRGRGWLAIAAVAALIGGAVGAGVTALFNNGSPTSTVIQESNASPGAATLSGNVTIPSLVQKVLPAVVSIDVKSQGSEDQGTGMIISSDGMVITNNHVIALDAGGSGTITVTESGTTKAQAATLVGTDPANDVALLNVTGASNLPTITFGNSNKAQVGDAVVAIGNALGLAAGTPTVTQGIVSALGRTVTAGDSASANTETLTNLIQTDAAINPGNSGGPLIDTSGQVIGMNTAVAGSTSDGSSAQNIGFAIPSAKIESLLPELEKGGVAANGGGYLGFEITTLTAQLRQQYGFTPTSGAVILAVVSGSPADKAGLQQGDVIVGIDSTTIASADDVSKVVSGDKVGQQVSVTYYQGAEKKTAQVTLGSQAEAQQQQSSSGSSGSSPLSPIPGF